MQPLAMLLADVRDCTLCDEHLPLGPRPVVQMDSAARILIVGQAPGRKIHWESPATYSTTRLRSHCYQWDFATRERASPVTLAIGQYALAYHLPSRHSLTETVQSWREHGPDIIPLPHPSPRNNLWLRRNPRFEEELLPELKSRVAEALD